MIHTMVVLVFLAVVFLRKKTYPRQKVDMTVAKFQVNGTIFLLIIFRVKKRKLYFDLYFIMCTLSGKMYSLEVEGNIVINNTRYTHNTYTITVVIKYRSQSPDRFDDCSTDSEIHFLCENALWVFCVS